MTWQTWLLLPLIAAAIGWFTNFVAVRMIFRPREPVSLLGFKVQGVLPRRRREFAQNIGSTVHDHLVSADDVKHLLDDPTVSAKLKEAVAVKIDDFIATRLLGGNPMLAGFLKGPFIDKMKEGLVEEVGTMFSDGIELLGDHLDENLDMKAIVEKKIMNFDMSELEQIVLRVAKKELRTIEFLGAVLGFLVGLLQLLVLHLLQ